MTTIRLAYNPGPVNAYNALSVSPSVRQSVSPAGLSSEGNRTLSELKTQSPTPVVRLALGNGQAERNGTSGLESPPTVRLELGGAHSTDKVMAMVDPATRPALLVSYVYLAPFLKNRHRYSYRDWVLDSGAFSAHNSGTEIKLQSYIDCCKELLASDSTLTEVFALDVIGDWKASIKNCEEMWRQGVQAIPCYHVGDPESELKAIAKDYPKIALGGAVGYRGKDKWAEQCFARIWPKAIHGFGFGSETSIMTLPWHSVDATNWEIGPCKFGRWNAFGQMSVRGSKQNLRAEVEWYLKLEQRARTKWAAQMKQLDASGPVTASDGEYARQSLHVRQISNSIRLDSRQPTADSRQLDLQSTRPVPEENGLSVRLATKVSGREKYLERP